MHTPGPWKADPTDFIFDHPATWRIVDSYGVVAEIESHNEADARLIAAAPVLLATLQELRRHLIGPHFADARALLASLEEQE
jgi:hypothetical protein